MATAVKEIAPWIGRMHALIIGPGLGRDEVTLSCVVGLIEAAKAANLPLILDADGLFLLTKHPNIIKDYPLVTLSPNAVEFTRLVEALKSGALPLPSRPSVQQQSTGYSMLCDYAAAVFALNVSTTALTVVQKGATDGIFNSDNAVDCTVRVTHKENYCDAIHL